MTNSPVPSTDAFDEIFYATHGVGDKGYADIDVTRRQMDNNEPTHQERMFSRYIARGDNQTDAYVKAFGFNDDSKRAYCQNAGSRLAKRQRVQECIFEERHKINSMSLEELPDLIAQLNSDRDLARALGQPSAAMTAVKIKAGLLGLDQERNVTNNINLNITDKQRNNLLDRIGKINSGHKVIDAEFTDVTP